MPLPGCDQQELAMTSERTIRPLFLLAIALTLLMALLPKPPPLPIDRFGDKFEHMLAFSVLAFLARFSFQRVSYWRMLEHLSFFGALIEVCQSLPVLHRDCDARDWVADTVAAALMLLVAHWLAPRLGPNGTDSATAVVEPHG
jgi:VanZ family protein